MDPNAPMTPSAPEPSSGGSRNTLLTLASILVLAGVVGITLFLYIQNSTSKPQKLTTNTNESGKTTQSTKNEKVLDIKNQELVKKYGAFCKRFNSLAEALKESEVACDIDLSKSKLTEIPSDVKKLKKLSSIDFSGNELTEFPYELLDISTLQSLNLDNNKIDIFNSPPLPTPSSNQKELPKMPKLQYISIKNNPLSAKTKNELRKYFGNRITF